MTWRLRLHYSPECPIVSGQSPEDNGSQAEPGNQENDNFRSTIVAFLGFLRQPLPAGRKSRETRRPRAALPFLPSPNSKTGSSNAQNARLDKNCGPRLLFSTEAGSRNFSSPSRRITLCFDVAYDMSFERIASRKACLDRYS